MSFAFDTTYLASPGNDILADLKSDDISRTPMPALPSPITPRRIRVTAVINTCSDGSNSTTYNVEEVPRAAERVMKAISPPLLGCRRSRSRSQSSIRSDELSPRTPSPSIFGSLTSLSPFTPFGAPRIGCLPSSALEDGRVAFPDPEWAAYDSDSSSGRALHCTNALRFEPFADEEEPHYYLPTNLFSPELEMSEAEFKESVFLWIERRKNRKAYKGTEDARR
ncbi:uncharacterized protein PHACADRAFT_206651 [Phanerochaete carnosa HHB-10118-sp]|uniref:Uncharacterized protein n=1 Tax=Phanerochaete carnosa (strain HHB-10118-sp) TaxID=650164 RepID=K5WFC0_PHACS|nr:uncharacterized protein PHACADRAFT_206651 [Phanerochaete carnosa HHB-10118-sp]EKM57774.1 hypothetical protein PHACADRAFT_206651 [Phanerochaete carnosa HHB-10118-sp]